MLEEGHSGGVNSHIREVLIHFLSVSITIQMLSLEYQSSFSLSLWLLIVGERSHKAVNHTARCMKCIKAVVCKNFPASNSYRQ